MGRSPGPPLPPKSPPTVTAWTRTLAEGKPIALASCVRVPKGLLLDDHARTWSSSSILTRKAWGSM